MVYTKSFSAVDTSLNSFDETVPFLFFWFTSSICLNRFGSPLYFSRACRRSFNLDSQKFRDCILRVFLQTIWKDYVTMMQLRLNQGYGRLPSIHICISWVCFGRLVLFQPWQSCVIDKCNIKNVTSFSDQQCLFLLCRNLMIAGFCLPSSLVTPKKELMAEITSTLRFPCDFLFTTYEVTFIEPFSFS